MRSDIDRYKQQVARLDLGGIDFAAFRDRPLAHRDPAITTFLTLWSYEEMWHGDAIGHVLAAHGEAEGARRIGPMRRRLGARDRLSPVLHSLGSSVAGDVFPALHMTWGAVNEWTTQAGYVRLSNRAGHPVLTDLLARIMRQEGRHIAFYAAQAESRLGENRRVQRVVRWALRYLWRPVGAGVMPRSEVAFLVCTLFGDAAGRLVARRIDQRIDRLSGLAGLHLVEGAIDRYCPPDPPAVGARSKGRGDGAVAVAA